MEGFFFDTVSVHKTVQLSPREAMKDPRTAGILRSIMGQFDLRFILKLPTRVDSANATSVSEDGWSLCGVCPWERIPILMPP